MKKELEDKLFADFPDIFPGGRDVDPRENLMCFGFECGDGWYQLIYDLCVAIQKELDADAEQKPYFRAMQVKEKFGGLRFYVSAASDGIFDLIEKAEAKSLEVCEVCGAAGRLRDINGWHTTLCAIHYEEAPPCLT